MNGLHDRNTFRRTTQAAALLALAGAASGSANAGIVNFSSNWAAASSSQWQNNGAWTNGAPNNLPGFTSWTANITAPGGAYNVILDANNNWTVTNINVNSSAARLVSTTGSLTVTDSATFTNGDFTIGDTLTLQNGGTIGSSFEFNGAGSVNVTGGILRNEGLIDASAGSTLNFLGTVDLDGNTGDGQIRATQTTGGGLSFTSAPADAFDGVATLREDNQFTFLSGWSLGSGGSLTFTVNSTNNTDAVISGGTFSNNGAITVNSNVNARIASTFDMNGGSIAIGSGSELEIDGASDWSGGAVSGAGTLRTDGDLNVTGLANIAPTVFDWDGASGSGHDTSITGILNIDAARIDGGSTSSDGYDGNVTISSGGVLDVDIDGSFWRLDGTMTLNTSNSISAVNGDEMRVLGSLTSTNAARVDAPVRIESSGSVSVGGGDLIDFHGQHTSAGGSYSGSGAMRMTAGWDVVSNTTINVGTLDWDGVTASGALTRLLNGADLIINSSINDPMDNDVSLSNGSILTLNQGSSQFTMGGDFDLAGGTINGNATELNMVGDVSGFGTIDLKFDGSASSDIIATGDLTIGRATSAFGFDHEGTLSVGAHDVLVRSGNQSFLGSMTTIAGGSLSGTVTVQLDSGDVLEGFGDVGRIANATGAIINATGNLDLGSFSSTLGYGGGGTLNIGNNTVTLRDANIADLGAMTTMSNGSLVAQNGVSLGVNETLTGSGAIHADVSNVGTIEATGSGLTFHGQLNGVGQQSSGTRFTFASTGSFEGAGAIGAQVVGSAGSVITATGDLDLGLANNNVGFSSSGELHVGAHTVRLFDNNAVQLGSMTTIAGGTLRTQGGLLPTFQLGSGDVLSGFGDVDGDVNGSSGSTITATGALSLGRGTSSLGFSHAGNLNVNNNTVTLRDSTVAALGADTFLDGGTLVAANGLDLGSGDTLRGHGTIDADVNNAGTILAQNTGLTFNGVVNGGGVSASGSRFTFGSSGGFTGDGLIDAEINGAVNSVITATGDLTMGKFGTANGFFTLGELHVGEHTVTLRDSNASGLGDLTTLAGGTLAAINSVGTSLGDRITGWGTIDVGGNFNNLGIIAPEMSPGEITVDGSFTNSLFGRFEMDLAGANAGQYDRVNITGAAALGGRLDVFFADGFNPDWGDEFALLSFASSTGDFATVNLPSLDADLFWYTEMTANQYLLGVRTAADVNHDGTVDFADLNSVLDNYNESGAGLLGDANEDGVVDFADLNLVLASFNMSAPPNVVPTPGGVALLGLALSIAAKRRRR